jgi:hypothetical protein
MKIWDEILMTNVTGYELRVISDEILGPSLITYFTITNFRLQPDNRFAGWPVDLLTCNAQLFAHPQELLFFPSLHKSALRIQKSEYRISNKECRMMKEGILSIYKKR